MIELSFGPIARLAAILSLTSFIGASHALSQPTDKVVAANFAPLMIEGDAEYPGYAIEVLEEAAGRAGRRVDLTFLHFQRAMEAVQSGPATLMPALFYGKKRNDKFMWVVEIQTAKMRFSTTSAQVSNFETARTLSSIVVERDSTADTMLTNLGFENLVRVGVPASSAQMLNSGRVDAWFQNQRAMTQAWQRLNLKNALILGDIVHEVPMFLVASPTLPQNVADAYAQSVIMMKNDGTLDTLWRRYNPE